MKVVEDLSIRELKLLAELPRIRSVRSFAAERGISAQALSKSIQRLEQLLDMTLLQRSSVGVVPSTDALELSLWAREVMQKVEALPASEQRHRTELFPRKLTLGTRAFLNTLLSGPILRNSELSDVGWRFIDLSPHETIEAARRGGLQVAVTLGKLPFPDDWRVEKVGELEWALYVRQHHPVAAVVKKAELAGYAFTYAKYWDGTSVVRGENFTPFKDRDRRLGHGMQTAHTAIEIALATNHIVTVPKLLARAFVERGELREVSVRGSQPQSHSVYLAVHSDLVSAPLHRQLSKTVSNLL